MTIRLLIQHKCEVILAIYWLLTQIIIYSLFGVVQSVDSPVYINAANQLIGGTLPDSHDIYYISYILFLAAIFYLGGSVNLVVLAQIALSGIATILLYHGILRISKDKAIAGIAVFLFIFWFKIHQWNVYIYTDSFFTSLLIISFFILTSLKTWRQYLVAVPFFLFNVLVRPPGISLMLALLACALTHLHKRRFKRLNSPVLFFLTVFFLIIIGMTFNRVLGDFSFIESYLKAEVIYPNIQFLIEKPEDLFVPDHLSSPLFKVLSFIFNNPIYFFKLFLIKLLLFLGNVKPYFSWAHNLFIITFLYPIYFFAIKGHKSVKIDMPILNFLRVIIISQAAIVMLTSENWDGRFLIPVLPFIFILASFGIRRVFRAPLKARH